MKWNIRELYRQLTSDDGRWREFALPRAVVRWSVVFYRELERDKAFIRAGGMAYITLIALVPMLLLVFGVLGATGLLAPSREAIERLFFDTFLGDVPGVKDFLLPGLLQVDLATLGIVGVLGLLVVTGRLYLTVEKAYNDIFGAGVDRAFAQRVLNFYFTLTALPVAVGVGFVGTQDWLTLPGMSLWATPLLTFGMLLGALKLFPCTPVRWPPALVGAFVSGLLLEFGRRLFPLYIRLFASDDPLHIVYGSLGLIPVFLLWLYLLWVFVLLGVEVAYVAQHFNSLAEAEFEMSDADARLLEAPTLSLAFEVLVRIAAAFEAGAGPVRVEALAEGTGVPIKALRGVLRVHERAGYVLRTDAGYSLARPPARLVLSEILTSWRHLTSVRRQEGDVVGDAIARALTERFPGTLADALARWDPLAEDEAPAPGEEADPRARAG